MATKLPYVIQPGTISKILIKIKDAKTPERFTRDYLSTKLNFKGGTASAFIPFAKKLGLLNTDGKPSDLYKKYRNSSTSKAALAQAIKIGYRELFERNEYANVLDKEKLKGLVVEITGLESKSNVVQKICQTFETLKKLADFEEQLPDKNTERDILKDTKPEELIDRKDFDLNLSYTINLVLPKTDDPAVFNAIFRSLRENLLRK